MVRTSVLISQFCCLLLLALFTHLSVAAEIVAHTDRADVGMNESFTLVFEATGSIDDDPDFTPLQKDFDILNTEQSSNISIINGDMKRNRSWTVHLFPKHTGEITIPEIAFGKDKSPSLLIKVNKQGNRNQNTGRDIFLEVSAEPRSAYVQQQVVYTVKLYRAVVTNNASLTDLEINSSDAVVQRLGEDRSYDTVIGGRRYSVFERRYVLFPQKAGSLRIPPVQFTGTVGSSRRGLFDFDVFGNNGRMVRERSDAVAVDIKPIPSGYKGQTWLPAESVQLSESWSPDPPVFTVGEPVTRSVTLAAVGLTAAQLPELNMHIPADLKQYPDQPNLQDTGNDRNTVGTRIEKLALIPTRPGRYTLPAIQVPWWNTKTQKQEIARLPSRVIDVAPAANQPAGTNTQPLPGNNQAVAPQSGGGAPVANQAAGSTSAGFWPWVSLALALGWLATLLLWLRSVLQRRSVTEKEVPASKPDPAAALKRLRIACRDNDPQAAKQALLQWGLARWPERGLHSLDAIASATGGTAAEQIRLLSDRLYRPGAAEWQGDALRQAIERWDSTAAPTGEAEKPVLQPLHKIGPS